VNWTRNEGGRMGRVAAGIAAEMNDELTIILSAATEAIREMGPGEPARELLLEARSAAQRCAWRVANLLAASSINGIGGHAI